MSPYKINRGRAGRRFFPPEQQAQAKAIACERPEQRDEPLSRYSLADLALILKREEIVPKISRSTLCRWYQQDALRPWRYHSWLFPRDPEFLSKATVVLELYQGLWLGQRLGADDYILSADEKAGLQLLNRLHPTRAPLPDQVGQVEFEDDRLGTLAYQAALEVRRGQVLGQISPNNTKATFDQFVDEVMAQAPYRTARRVFWLVDSAPAHHPATFPARLAERHEQAIAVYLPVHASWLNQVEVYFSILQRKALTRRDFSSAEQMAQRILAFQARFSAQARPFHWKFTADDLRKRLQSLT